MPGTNITPEKTTSVAVGLLLGEIASFLKTLNIDSDGGRLVIDRTDIDLTWLAKKLTDGDYIVHVPIHRSADAKKALDGMLATSTVFKRRLQIND